MSVRLFHMLIGSVVFFASLGLVFAADNPPNQPNQPNGMTEGQIILPSSQVSDLDVYQASDTSKKLGKVDNLIIFAHTGRILYGVLHTGVAGRNIPVPWSAFQLQTGSDNKHFLTLNKTQDDIESAPTFHRNLTIFVNRDTVAAIDAFFAARSTMPRMANVPEGTLPVSQMIVQSSRLSDLKVYNRKDANQKLGSITNLIINVSTGHVLYGIVDTGIGGKNVPVPWNAFLLVRGEGRDRLWLTLDKSSDDMKLAPSVERKQEVNVAQYGRSADEFFGVRTAARPRR